MLFGIKFLVRLQEKFEIDPIPRVKGLTPSPQVMELTFMLCSNAFILETGPGRQPKESFSFAFGLRREVLCRQINVFNTPAKKLTTLPVSQIIPSKNHTSSIQ